MDVTQQIERARDKLAAATRVTVLTGAGVSAASGVPTFRGAGGLWRNRQAQQLATPEAFAQDPLLVWEWYAWRRQVIAGCEPNPAHHAIARWSEREGFTLVTQNVDGLHERVAPPGAIIERVHGTLATDKCLNPACDHVEHLDFNNLPPLRDCPRCTCRMRPAVVWFGEMLDQDLWFRCVRAAEAADLMLVVGTSGEVYPAASLVTFAAEAGAKIITANLEPSPLDKLATVALHARAAEILPQLIN